MKLPDRPSTLNGVTYELVLDHLPSSIFITINHRQVEGKAKIHELFINSWDSEVLTWSPLCSRLVSAVLRQGGDSEFLYKELQDMFAVNSFFYKGKQYTSVVSLIGELLERHQKYLDSYIEKEGD
jgi:hypothetical protein